MGTPYKMNGFSGFGNSPVKQTKKGDTLTAASWKEADDEVTNLKRTRNIEGLNKRHGVTYTKKNNSNVYTDASGRTVKENESTYLTPQTDKNSPMKQGKTSWKSKAKSAWYTMMHHDGGKSSIAEQWKTYRDKKKEFRDNNKGKKAGEPDKNVSWKSGF
jgi:hypothetical protein